MRYMCFFIKAKQHILYFQVHIQKLCNFIHLFDYGLRIQNLSLIFILYVFVTFIDENKRISGLIVSVFLSILPVRIFIESF